MKSSTAIFLSLALGPFQGALGYPGMGNTIREISKRADDDSSSSTELLGDLKTLPDSELTEVGKDVKQLLQGGGSPESSATYSDVAGLGSDACRADTCCVWNYIASDMYELFRGESGRCTKWARYALRLGFHDAAVWSKATADQGGGADGSIVLSDELSRGENSGLQDMGTKVQEWYDRYHTELGFEAVTMADVVQMGATVATVTCPMGPRIKSYVGRRDNSSAGATDMIPSPFREAEELIELFGNKTIGPRGLVALLGAHTVSQQRFIDTTRAKDPQDSTPGVWDTLYYSQMLSNDSSAVPARVFRFPSDIALSQHASTRGDWQDFAARDSQAGWNTEYAREYIRLSLLGVNNINNLTECTKVLPAKTTSFSSSDQAKLSKWVNSEDHSDSSKLVSEEVRQGKMISMAMQDIPAE